MAKVGKLTKLKSAMKRLPSFTKLSRSNSSVASAATAADNSDHLHYHQRNDNNSQVHAVYVGKARRRYFLSSDIICHPLFQELVERSGGFDEDGEVEVACEVVLFEHLLWMLESGGTQLGSMQELVEFYTC
ncbi:Auxin responsive SAUR protein [Melia azedarach]|uniref:Auxin responsive SAUR protein n=1 Tax=Melia azedarach TaxID=155640 RepID=A0ACC1Y290_MELAZ|nr:Auxin responsive SAUR protein [Melia azedarach]